MSQEIDPLNPDDVRDRESFIKFVSALADERRESAASEKISPSSPYGPAALGWENVTIEDFLDAALAWSNQALPEEPSWRAFASFLYCGKIYE